MELVSAVRTMVFRKYTTYHKLCASLPSMSEFNSKLQIHPENKLILKPKVLFVLGGPGAGKGTQCSMLSKEFGMIHLSAGELLRAERQSDSSNGNLIESYLKEGRIVPVQITLDLLRREVLSKKCNRYLIDGFPRNWDNIQGWESTMPEVCDMEAVLFIDCPENVLEDRILNRGLTSGRSDDNVETVRKRFATYRESTIPILQHYAGSEKLFRVRGDQSKDEVFNHLKNAIIPLVKVELMNIHSYLRKVHVLKDWDSYKQLCDIDIVTSLKTSQINISKRGLGCHKEIYFDTNKANPAFDERFEEMDVLGTTAVVQSLLTSISDPISLREKRSWQLIGGEWKLVKLEIYEL